MVRIVFIGRLLFVGLELGVLFAIASGLVDIPISQCLHISLLGIQPWDRFDFQIPVYVNIS